MGKITVNGKEINKDVYDNLLETIESVGKLAGLTKLDLSIMLTDHVSGVVTDEDIAWEKSWSSKDPKFEKAPGMEWLRNEDVDYLKVVFESNIYPGDSICLNDDFQIIHTHQKFKRTIDTVKIHTFVNDTFEAFCKRVDDKITRLREDAKHILRRDYKVNHESIDVSILAAKYDVDPYFIEFIAEHHDNYKTTIKQLSTDLQYNWATNMISGQYNEKFIIVSMSYDFIDKCKQAKGLM